MSFYSQKKKNIKNPAAVLTGGDYKINAKSIQKPKCNSQRFSRIIFHISVKSLNADEDWMFMEK